MKVTCILSHQFFTFPKSTILEFIYKCVCCVRGRIFVHFFPINGWILLTVHLLEDLEMFDVGGMYQNLFAVSVEKDKWFDGNYICYLSKCLMNWTFCWGVNSGNRDKALNLGLKIGNLNSVMLMAFYLKGCLPLKLFHLKQC